MKYSMLFLVLSTYQLNSAFLFQRGTKRIDATQLFNRKERHGTDNNMNLGPPTFDSALAIVPPGSSWDRLQRARHFARDTSYTVWPPAIRLFHPFCPDPDPLAVAAIVEKYNITAFEIHLNEWSIIPHAEAMEADWLAMQQLIQQQGQGNGLAEQAEIDEQAEIEALIAREEEIGKQKLKQRQKKGRKSGSNVPSREDDEEERDVENQQYDSPRALLEKQRRMYEEFNGPCVVCLEPDSESRELLKELREILTQELFGAYDKYSVSSSVSMVETLPQQVMEGSAPSEYRPVVPIAAFPTVNSAMDTARKLRALWQPLSFTVTDLHFLSRRQRQSPQQAPLPTEEHLLYNDNAIGSFENNEEYHLSGGRSRWMQEEKNLASEQYGCDALVMLVGEEVAMDQEVNSRMVEMICTQGQAGGGDNIASESDQARYFEDVVEEDRSTEIEQWLEEDDDFDEGTVVVIGRTHFFSGEMRAYVGMPATSVMDGKDRLLGESLSGAARRRASVHRSGNMFEDGDWGRRGSDYLPKKKRKRNTDVF